MADRIDIELTDGRQQSFPVVSLGNCVEMICRCLASVSHATEVKKVEITGHPEPPPRPRAGFIVLGQETLSDATVEKNHGLLKEVGKRFTNGGVWLITNPSVALNVALLHTLASALGRRVRVQACGWWPKWREIYQGLDCTYVGPRQVRTSCTPVDAPMPDSLPLSGPSASTIAQGRFRYMYDTR